MSYNEHINHAEIRVNPYFRRVNLLATAFGWWFNDSYLSPSIGPIEKQTGGVLYKQKITEGGFMKRENTIIHEIYTKQNTSILLVLLTVFFLVVSLTGCASDNFAQNDGEITGKTSSTDCLLCGDNGENVRLSLWGQDNIALVSLSTFDVQLIGINQFDAEGKMREEYAGVVSFAGGESKDGGFSAHLLVNFERGYATGTVELNNDAVFDYEKVSSSLCEDCLEKLEFQRAENCVGVAAINL